MCVVNRVCAEFSVQSSEHHGLYDRCAYVNVNVNVSVYFSSWYVCVRREHVSHVNMPYICLA
jgi:hypothetical protein